MHISLLPALIFLCVHIRSISCIDQSIHFKCLHRRKKIFNLQTQPLCLLCLYIIFSSICCVYNHDPTGSSACPVSNQTCPHPKNDKNRFLRRVLPAKDLLPHQQTMFVAKIQKTLVLCIMCLDESGWKIANANGVDSHNFRLFFLFFLLSAGHLLLQQGNICTRVPDSDSARVWWQPTKFGNHQISRTLDDFTSFQLVGGFNLLYLKNISQLGSFPQVSRDKYKHKQSLKTTT